MYGQRPEHSQREGGVGGTACCGSAAFPRELPPERLALGWAGRPRYGQECADSSANGGWYRGSMVFRPQWGGGLLFCALEALLALRLLCEAVCTGASVGADYISAHNQGALPAGPCNTRPSRADMQSAPTAGPYAGASADTWYPAVRNDISLVIHTLT